MRMNMIFPYDSPICLSFNKDATPYALLVNRLAPSNGHKPPSPFRCFNGSQQVIRLYKVLKGFRRLLRFLKS